MRNAGSVQSVARTLVLLKAFTPQEPWLGLSQLARKVQLPVSTVHRLAQALVEGGMISRDSAGRYSVGPELYAVGTLYLHSTNIREASTPVLKLLNDLTSESINVSILSKSHVVLIMKEESKHAFRVAQQVGSVYPAYASSMGKALLSQFSERQLDELYPHEQFVPLTKHTVTNKTLLKRELEDVKLHDVAFDLEGSYLGVVCVASPIRDASGNSVAAMSISGPLVRMEPRLVDRFAPLVRLGAQAISYRLGQRGNDLSAPDLATIEAFWMDNAEDQSDQLREIEPYDVTAPPSRSGSAAS
jgi:DNA-binding IclR family transcriptional regulator